MAHTIVLFQPGKLETRTYWDFESLNDALEYICHIYETHLKQDNPGLLTITYDVSQLFDYLDSLTDLSCMVFQRADNMYAPFPREWIKEKIFIFLKREASKNSSQT
ncbi:Enhancer of rudimentary -like protein [Sarcoptes scabiei]|uniref:Enhancer of rudimentary homolog n=1 Tax=Sarcoptes scabiei TaxID=52283 RepID=A0A131ZXY2_SARSC|nr:Enhancer of rudimentary -like protein [Sarcoptes scabiei]KPM03554.1 enhancer of rudimentary-like protein [Sarcoptes scabiei]UXI20952.1 SSUH2 protein [Sarcoptes scabiei]